jgi:hypothetical protein
MSSKYPANTEQRQDYAAKLFASAFYDALGNGMSEAEADAYATRRVYASRFLYNKEGRARS